MKMMLIIKKKNYNDHGTLNEIKLFDRLEFILTDNNDTFLSSQIMMVIIYPYQ